MPDARSTTTNSARSRIRAGKACKRCNQKRIKCDAMHHMPCTHCIQDGHIECVLRESKRGTYIRKVRVQNVTGDQSSAGNTAGCVSSKSPNAATEADDIASLPMYEPDIIATATAARVPISAPDQTTETELLDGPATTDPGHHDISLQIQDAQTPDARPAASPDASNSLVDQPSLGHDDNASSYRDISWSVMFDHFLNSRENGREFIDKCSITYLGESFPLAIVLGDLNEGGGPKLHHPGPPFPAREVQAEVPSQLQPAHLMPEDLEYLRSKGVFEFPDKAHLDAFLSVFLERVYPLYPIVNREELIQQHINGKIPLILLHSISFIASTFCPLSVLHLAGFLSRRDARCFFYKKVKALFDLGYEVNKIVILQSAILMSFWGGGPNNYWNFYSWISTAVTVAEAVGIHRSTATTNMRPQDKSLLRRLWWILVVRDSICSALVGRPFRIDMDQSDTEMLTVQDFAHDATASDFLENPRHQKYAQYQIETAKLSLILRDIVMSRFYPGRPSVRSETLHTRLDDWKGALPSALTWQEETPDHLNPFSASLSIQYNHHLILIYLEITNSAAQNISTAACTIVMKSSFLVMPHELFHGIFLAQAVFYTKIKSCNELVAQLSRSALTNCQMVLHVISECWDPSPWIMQLFDSLSAKRLEKQSYNSGQSESGEESEL
ncbi:fungal-specific transcription factor domain-containing protein [Lipomyces doorenjongii]